MADETLRRGGLWKRRLRVFISLFFVAAGCTLVVLWVQSYQYSYWFRLRKIESGLGVVRSWNGALSYEELVGYRPLQKYKISVPYGALTIAAGACAALPWVAWSRRFSLRALAIVTTLVAVAAGVASMRR